MRIVKCILLLSGLGTGFALTSCDDIIEPEIATKQVQLLTPADSATSTSVLQNFRWEPVAGAREYRIQIAAPSFENPAAFFLDSTTSHTSFATALVPGKYCWRVLAQNAGYSTQYTTRSFGVDSTGSLATQNIALLRPANNSVGSQTLITFAWTPLPMAQRYVLTVLPNPRTVTGTFDTVLTSTNTATVQLRLPARSQAYRWKLTAINATSLRESATQSFEVDVTAPGTPALGTPVEGQFFTSLPITMSWTRTGTDVTADSLFLYSSDQSTLISSFPRMAASPSFTVPLSSSFLPPGTYYWAVRSVDRAGNVSPRTLKRSFILQ